MVVLFWQRTGVHFGDGGPVAAEQSRNVLWYCLRGELYFVDITTDDAMLKIRWTRLMEIGFRFIGLHCKFVDVGV